MQYLLLFLLGIGSLIGSVSRSDDAGQDPDPTEPVDEPTDEDNTPDQPSRVPAVPDIDPDSISGLHRVGTSANERLSGGPADDLIIGGGGRDMIVSGRGDDTVWALNSAGQTGIYTQSGDDTIAASVPGRGQIHINSAEGNDRVILDMTNEAGFQSFHVYTGTGEDRVEFENLHAVKSPILGRIDDFDPSRDTLVFEGQELDLGDLPEGIDVVSYNGQQWLRFEDKALFAIEGARDGGWERHFTELPDDMAALEVVDFQDPQNFVPKEFADMDDASFNYIEGNGRHIMGTAADDWIRDGQRHTSASGSEHDHDQDHAGHDMSAFETASNMIMAGAGDDVVDAGKGDDTVHGGDGNDSLAGGLDDDVLYGEAGDDVLFGGTGEDYLDGGDGDDLLYGGRGDDILRGGPGQDRMFGGEGRDTFLMEDGSLKVWSELEGTDEERLAQLDVIEDFSIGEDLISLGEDRDIDMEGLSAWRIELDGRDGYVMHLRDTDERFIIHVEDDDEDGDEGWSELMEEGNFAL